MSQTSSSAFGPDLRAALVAMVRKRVPESEVEDIVQATLAEAIGSPNAPTDSDALRRWIFGVAKHKVVDYHRRAGRETFDMPEVAGGPAPHLEADLLRWAEKNLPPGEDAKKTLDWMLREGDGEKLESIAETERVPAPRVRQRVSRLRRHLKEHWQREVALLAACGVLVTVAVVLWLRRGADEPIAHDPSVLPADPRALRVREEGLELCAEARWTECVGKLDEARRLDPAGDTRPEVKRARDDAAKALTPSPTTLPPLEPSAPAPPTSAVPSVPSTSAPTPPAKDVFRSEKAAKSDPLTVKPVAKPTALPQPRTKGSSLELAPTPQAAQPSLEGFETKESFPQKVAPAKKKSSTTWEGGGTVP